MTPPKRTPHPQPNQPILLKKKKEKKMVVWFDLSLMMALIMRIGVFHKSIFFFKTLIMVYFLIHNNFQIFHKS